jgi:hypothetical protein
MCACSRLLARCCSSAFLRRLFRTGGVACAGLLNKNGAPGLPPARRGDVFFGHLSEEQRGKHPSVCINENPDRCRQEGRPHPFSERFSAILADFARSTFSSYLRYQEQLRFECLVMWRQTKVNKAQQPTRQYKQFKEKHHGRIDQHQYRFPQFAA